MIDAGNTVVGPAAAVAIGLTGGIVCYFMVGLVKRRWLIDDSLDVFAVHGVGGAIGVVLTAIFVDAALGGAGGRSIGGQFAIQLTGLAATLLWSAVFSFVIAKVAQAVTGQGSA